jgi:hypothetical protein
MRKFFLDVDPKMESASEIIGNCKIIVRKSVGCWNLSTSMSYGTNVDGTPDWITDNELQLSEKELRALYHIITLKAEKEE